MNASWTIAILLLIAAALMAYSYNGVPYSSGRAHKMSAHHVRLPYRPQADMGSNVAAPTQFDLKALCATTDEC